MSRILRRPMFRGGSPNKGITTGLGRVGFDKGGFEKVQSQLKLIDQLAPRGGNNLNNFLIGMGLNMVGNPPSGNIFQTAAKQAQGPFQQFQAAEAQEAGSRRNLVASLVGQLSEEDLDKVQQMIPYYMETFNVNEEEAIKMIVEKDYYSKEGRVDPRIQKSKDLKDIKRTFSASSAGQITNPAYHKSIAEFIYNYDRDLYKGVDRSEILPEMYINEEYIQQGMTANNTPFTQINDSGEIIEYALSDAGIRDLQPYEGRIIFDPRTKQLFRIKGARLIRVDASIEN